MPADGAEAWQMLQLHGSSVDLAVVHRESRDGSTDDGFGFIKQFRSDPAQADLPFILTTEKWTDKECAAHQAGPEGANAYLIQPFPVEKLVGLIEAVTGQKLVEQAAPSAPKAPPRTAPTPAPAAPKAVSKTPFSGEEASIPGLVLEDASEIFTANEIYEPSDTSIKLEMPVFEADEQPAMAAPVEAAPASAELAAPPELAAPAELAMPAGVPAEGLAIELGGGGAPAIAAPASTFELPVEGFEPPPVGDELSLPTAGGDLRIPADAFEPAPPDLGDDLPSISSPEPAQVIGATQYSMPAPPAPEPAVGEFDAEAAQEMPYLFKQKEEQQPARDLRMIFAQPVGDAVVPGGAANSPDLETLKKFLLLREQDVGALSTQLKSAREQVAALEDELRKERSRNVELTHQAEDQSRRIENFEREKQDALVGLRSEIDELNFKLKVKTDKAKILESKVRAATEEMERLKERVRSDIRKIRVREKELENRLEILKKDSEVLITARENKVIELKRKLDLLEFNMDLLQDQYAREKETSASLREKLARAAQAMRVAGGMLDSDDGSADQEAS